MATKARGARTVKVIDLGFFPWTALAEGLLRERVERRSSKRRPVADYIKARDRDNAINGNPADEELLDGYSTWEAWLQDWRVELNAMAAAEFVAWMNAQFILHHASKVIPSEELALESVLASVEENLSLAADAEVRNERREELEELQRQMAALEAEIKEEAEERTADHGMDSEPGDF